MDDARMDRLLHGEGPELSQVPQRELEEYLGGLIREFDQDPIGPDADRLGSLGHGLHLAGWQRLDRTLGALLAEQPTARRLDTVCLILAGLWREGRAEPVVDDGVLEVVIRTHASLAVHGLDRDTERSYRSALGWARSAAQKAGETATAARIAAEGI